MALPPTNYGFPGTINSAALAKWLPHAGKARFSVLGADDWKVSSLPGLDRGIRIEAGIGAGDGVMSDFPEYDTRSLPAPAALGQSVWHLVANRRNWSSPATSMFTSIEGSSQMALPVRADQPGIESDQPVALVRVTGGESTVQEIIDLRVWAGDGGLEAAHTLALTFLNQPGAEVRIGKTTYRYTRQSNNVWDWEADYGVQLEGVPADKRPIIKQGQVFLRSPENNSNTTNAAGDGYHYFDTPFPNAMTACVAVAANDPRLWDAATEKFTFNYNEIYSNRFRFSFRVSNKDGAVVGNRTGIRVVYIAVGY